MLKTFFTSINVFDAQCLINYPKNLLLTLDVFGLLFMFYAKVDKDLTSTNQQIVKSTINDLIVKQELPATATNLVITTPRTSCIYFLPKIHKPNNSGRPIVSYCHKNFMTS